MPRGRLWAIILLTFLSVFQVPSALAVRPDSVKDTLSDSRKATNSRHTITVDMSATTVFSAGESFGLTFGSNFTLPALSASDISFDDGTSRTVLATCVAGANNIGLAVAGQVVTLSACAGFTSSAAGASVTIVVGTGSTLVSNPATSGIASLTVAGSYGDDSRTIAVAIIEGVTVSLTIPLPNGDVRFTGDVFPGAIVSILDGGMVAGTTVANAASFFDKTIQGLLPGLHTFGVFGQSLDGRRTLTLSFTINVVAGSTVTVSGILLPPVISVPASEKRPVALIESGLARHNSTVTTFTNSHNQISQQVSTNSNGEWSVSIGDVLHLGGHTASALVNDGNGNQSVLTDAKSFEVMLSADLNIDNLVSLTDFSMLMFNYGTSNPANKAADINDNGPVDLVDFSVMMFYWTGG